MKSLLEIRPVYHRLAETIRGNVFCSFLALMLKKKDLIATAPLGVGER
jgi:transposase